MVTKTWGYLEVLTSSDLNGAFAECATLTGTETLTNKKLQLQNASATPEANTMVNESIVKAWAYISADALIQESYNVSSCSRPTTGTYLITFKRAFAGYYAVAACPVQTDFKIANVYSMSTGQLTIAIYNTSFNKENQAFMFMALGPQ